jgi:predicted transposase YbfD/YdcC
LAALGRERHFADGRSEQETRYYILSQPLSAAAFGVAVRSHWGIENQVHWVLDVTVGEEHSRKRAGKAAHNFGLLLRFALNLLRQTPGKPGMSLKAKRLRAAWDTSYLFTILAAFKMR